MSNNRCDSPEMALRLLTGGHAIKVSVQSYDWKSVADDVVGESGVDLVKEMLSEGSLISFGRSESCSLMDQSKVKRSLLPPHGRLFPAVGTTYIKGYIHFVLRDAWNLIADCNMEVDKDSGHCRTFIIKVFYYSNCFIFLLFVT